eukprot:g6794.t1
MGAGMSVIGKKDPTVRLVGDLTSHLFDREAVLDSLDDTYWVVGALLNGRNYHRPFFENKGVQVMVKVMEHWKEDEVIIRGCCRSLKPLAQNPLLADQLRVVGARGALEQAMENNKLDDYIQNDCKEALRCINLVGAKHAMEEMRVGFEEKDPSRILQQLLDHPTKADLHAHAHTKLRALAGASATLLSLVAQAPTEPMMAGYYANQANGVYVVIDSIRRLRGFAAVQAKGLQLLAFLCKDTMWNSLIGKAGAIEVAVETWHHYDDPPDVEVQQWVLWLLNAMCVVPNNRLRMDRDGVKPILRALGKEAKERRAAAAKAGTAKQAGLWRMVPLDLRTCWTKNELYDEYEPEQPGEFHEREAIFFNHRVVAHPVNARHLDASQAAAAKKVARQLKKRLKQSEVVEPMHKPNATATAKGLANYDKASAWATTALSLADTKRKL